MPGGERNGRYVLKTVLDGGSGVSIIGEAGLHHLQHFREITLAHPMREGPRYLLPMAGRDTSHNKIVSSRHTL